MLAKFENGNYLEIIIKDDEYKFFVYDEEMDVVDGGWTEYRSIEMYYPMNEIDYILQYCEPDGVEGKYELLKWNTMDEYCEFLEEDPNGEWILETQGNEEDIKSYSSFEAARHAMRKEYKDAIEDYGYDITSVSEDDCIEIGCESCFQSWRIYKEKPASSSIHKILDEIEQEITRAYIGASQYAYELQDTYVITSHVDEIGELVKELRKLLDEKEK